MTLDVNCLQLHIFLSKFIVVDIHVSIVSRSFFSFARTMAIIVVCYGEGEEMVWAHACTRAALR